MWAASQISSCAQIHMHCATFSDPLLGLNENPVFVQQTPLCAPTYIIQDAFCTRRVSDLIWNYYRAVHTAYARDELRCRARERKKCCNIHTSSSGHSVCSRIAEREMWNAAYEIFLDKPTPRPATEIDILHNSGCGMGAKSFDRDRLWIIMWFIADKLVINRRNRSFWPGGPPKALALLITPD